MSGACGRVAAVGMAAAWHMWCLVALFRRRRPRRGLPRAGLIRLTSAPTPHRAPPHASIHSQVARGPDHTVHGTTTLARLHSACASVCHFLAQADRWTLTLCFGQPSTTSNGALLQRSEAAVAQDLLRALREAKHMLETAANHALEALHAIKPADQDSEAARQWDRCADWGMGEWVGGWRGSTP